MAVYTNDLRLKEITTGDESGTWGTSTNTNLSLIAEALSQHDIDAFINFGKELNLEAFVEFHSEENADIVAEIAPEIVGVNCRDLKTMTTDISYFASMAPRLPSGSIKVAESGIKTNDDLKYLADLSYDAVLVGTSLMKTGYPGKALEALIGRLS